MTTRKQRLTVTVDPHLVEAGQQAVESGQADSISGWVSAALEGKIEHDRKLAQLGAAVAEFEEEFGAISPDEILGQQRIDRENATIVRGKHRPTTRKAKSA
ncbi:MAG TPA: hypothetical protein VL068_01975 [Microthrixaceae bacterium]|nr:hypothetical protein [Microthrixaceae bacterium]